MLSADCSIHDKSYLLMSSFSEFLLKEMGSRGWRQAELSRQSKLDTAVISNLINDRRGPGPDTCKAIAKAFKMPVDTVYRAAGLLPPPGPGHSEYIQSLAHRIGNLPPTAQKIIESVIETLEDSINTE